MRVEAGDSFRGFGLAGGSGCWSVLVDEFSAGGDALDRLAEADHRRVGVVRRCSSDRTVSSLCCPSARRPSSARAFTIALSQACRLSEPGPEFVGAGAA